MLDSNAFIAHLQHQDTDIKPVIIGSSRVSPRWGYQERELDESLIYFVIDGQLEALVEPDRWQAVQPGGILACAPGFMHSFRLLKQEPATLYHMRFDFRTQAGRLAHQPGLCIANPAWELERYVVDLHDELETDQPLSTERMRALLTLIYLGMFRLQQSADSQRAAGVLSPAQRQQLFEYVSANLSSWPTPAQLAEHLRLSHDYFARRFAATFRVPPRSWLVQQRVSHGAYRLLDTNQSITQVAAELGYDEPFLFSRQFKQVMGQSPRDYRKQRQRPIRQSKR